MPDREIGHTELDVAEQASQDYADLGTRKLVEALKERLKGLPGELEYAGHLDKILAATEAARGQVAETADVAPATASVATTESAKAEVPGQGITMQGELWEVQPQPTGSKVISEHLREFYDLRDSLRLKLLQVLRFTNKPGLEWSEMEDRLPDMLKQPGLEPKVALLNNSVVIIGDGKINRVLAVALPGHSLEEMGAAAEWFALKDATGNYVERSEQPSYKIVSTERATKEPATVEFTRDESGEVVWKVVHRGELLAERKS